jgi:hypothetical protein
MLKLSIHVQGSRVTKVDVKERVVKIYVATVQALREKKR